MEGISAEQSDIVIKGVRDDGRDDDDDNHADVFSLENKSHGKDVSGTDSFNGVQAHKDIGPHHNVQLNHDVQPLQEVQPFQDVQSLLDEQQLQDVQPLQEVKPHQEAQTYQLTHHCQHEHPQQEVQPLQLRHGRIDKEAELPSSLSLKLLSREWLDEHSKSTSPKLDGKRGRHSGAKFHISQRSRKGGGPDKGLELCRVEF